MHCSIDHWTSVNERLADRYYGEPVPGELTISILSLCPEPEVACGRWIESDEHRAGSWEAFAIQGARIAYVRCDPVSDRPFSGRGDHVVTEAAIWPVSAVRSMTLLDTKRRGAGEVSWSASWKLILADREFTLPVPTGLNDDREQFASAVRDRLA